jgi:ABC-type lipoprotein export system ATPase subunit
VQSVSIVRESKVIRTPRVMQMEGMFEVPPSERSAQEWIVNLDLPAEWNVGLIVGPSGSGKTTVARELFGAHIAAGFDWPQDKSILDAFPHDMSIKEIIELLSSVGFSSPPSWVRPFHVLSNGEQFRVNMARTLAEMRDLAVVDEFTSVVDRTVAQIGSAAIQKTVRRRKQRFIAVSCHYDIAQWLEPDWMYEPHTDCLSVGRLLRRPEIKLQVERVHHSAWKLFSKHHYLDKTLNTSAQCFVAFIDDMPVAFCGVLSFPHAVRPGWRCSRLVTLPDYQGVGAGGALLNLIAGVFKKTGKPFFITTSHPAFVHSLASDKHWLMKRNSTRTANAGSSSSSSTKMYATLANHRLTCGFEYVG